MKFILTVLILMVSINTFALPISVDDISSGKVITADKLKELIAEVNSRPVLKVCYINADSTWDTNDPSCDFITLVRQTSPTTLNRYYIETTLGVHVNKCVVTHYSPCGNPTTSLSSDLSSYEPGYPSGAIGGFKGCNNSYLSESASLIIQCILPASFR